MFGSARFLILSILSILLSHYAFGQDLGSSNDLFVNPKAASTTAKRASWKRKATTAKHRNAARTAASRSWRSAGNSSPVVEKAVPDRAAEFHEKSVVVWVKPPIPVPPSPAVDKQFEKLIAVGNASRNQRDYSWAEFAYIRAKVLKPKDPRAVYGLGNLYNDQQRWEEAEISYRAAQKLDPANPIIKVALSYVLSQPVTVRNLSDRYEEAETLARRAIELAPANALAFDQLGVAMELQGIIFEQTEAAYRDAIRLDPLFAPAYAHLGRLLRRQGNLKESATAYANALKYSNDVPSLILVADVLQSELRYSESEPLLRRAVRTDPKNPAGLFLLGKALTALGKFGEAEDVLRKSLAASQNGFMANYLLGSLYERQGKYELAENVLARANHTVSPNEKRNLSIRLETVGDGYMKAGRTRDAERVYKQAVALDAERESLAAKLASKKSK
jgi:tetratricopeptide (TPR) repeat protein